MSSFTTSLRLHHRYVLRERIGRGGMSEVWRADDEVLGRPVAVKALAGELAADPQLRATIRREARAAARLSHPHVTQVYDYGEASLAGGVVVPYLVMELVDGRNLADRLHAGPLPWPEAVRMAGQVADALAAAHRIGVVHRDVKPGNVMLTGTGAKVLDFGIAALAGPHHPVAGQTGELLMGTPAYFAPERLRSGPPDPASDVYALGALLYRALTGRAPLPVQTWEDALDVHARRTPVPPPRVPGLPAAVADLVLACLDADPARRPTAGRLASRFGAVPPVEPPTDVRPAAGIPAGRATHPPTLVDRSARVAPSPAPGATRPVPVSPARRRADRPVAVFVAAGLALIVGLVAALTLGDLGDRPTTAGPAGPATPTVSAPASTPRSSAPPAPTTAAPAPSVTGRPVQVSLPQLAAQFVGLLARARETGEIDQKTVEKLRDDLVDLSRSRPKDRDKRLEDLREQVVEAVEDEGLSPAVAAQLDALLDRVDTGSRGGRDD
ncbi:serine/threonine-protein kinase [Micromonospora endolithica]|uniref:non-specific serine/threonine protein kinase n=1 Tax=Micromonospora endolithica TaxID=230091 RepID=A0A3A9ZUA5_9ACTN|nr:serine/threonine-protein kinase [Micromonospora endolithica]RKN51126.1 serine/threonine protein kinase [Micromonospora endolithica]TWJ22327.1 serine/threonine-protein kinase [Micromonospora endolithica]